MAVSDSSLRIERFRSTWGVDAGPAFSCWRSWFMDLRKQGYAGVEVDISEMQSIAELSLLRGLCDSLGLKLMVSIFTSWPRYAGPRPTGLLPAAHLTMYREQLKAASILAPVRINAQSGADYWTPEQAVEFFRGTLQIDAELSLAGRVCHETHRNRGLFTPYRALFVLEHVPELRITADFSHWVVVCERTFDINEEDRELMDRIIPSVSHIHTRMGTTQSIQCPEPTNPLFHVERTFFENIWKQIIMATKERGDEVDALTFVPEYGPFPYHPIGSASTFGELADAEGARLQSLFEEYVKE